MTLGVHPKIVQELLGHSQIFVTLDIYSHILPTLQGEAMQQLNEALTHVVKKEEMDLYTMKNVEDSSPSEYYE